jgi:hypothetical protein
VTIKTTVKSFKDNYINNPLVRRTKKITMAVTTNAYNKIKEDYYNSRPTPQKNEETLLNVSDIENLVVEEVEEVEKPKRYVQRNTNKAVFALSSHGLTQLKSNLNNIAETTQEENIADLSKKYQQLIEEYNRVNDTIEQKSR